MSDFNWPGLIVFSSILLGTPGPAVIALLYSGINYGFRNSLPYLFGIITGFLCNLLIIAFGIGVILEHELVYNILKYSMLVYIFYLSYKIATATPLAATDNVKPLLFYQGILLNLLNPKAYVTAVSSLSQFSLVTEYVYSVVWIIIINLFLALSLQGSWCLVGQSIGKIFYHPKWYKLVNYSLAVMLIATVIITYLK